MGKTYKNYNKGKSPSKAKSMKHAICLGLEIRHNCRCEYCMNLVKAKKKAKQFEKLGLDEIEDL